MKIKDKLIIQLSNKRTGSTFLQNCIDSHPHLHGLDEIYVKNAYKEGLKKSGFDPYVYVNDQYTEVEYLEKIVNSFDNKVVMKLMYNQAERWKELWSFIWDNQIPIIHLHRNNHLKQVLSGMILAWGKNEDGTLNISHDFIIDDIIKSKDDLEKWNETMSKYSGDIINIEFKELFGESEQDKTYLESSLNDKLCDFLNVEYYNIWSKTKKSNKKSNEQIIPDYDSFKEKLEGQSLEYLL